jgi:AraC-like DNA-binding protein
MKLTQALDYTQLRKHPYPEHIVLQLDPEKMEVAIALMNLLQITGNSIRHDRESWDRSLIEALIECGKRTRTILIERSALLEVSKDNEDMQIAKQLLSDPSSRLSIAEIAGRLGYTPVHFSRIFRSTAGTCPRSWRANARIEHATKMLEQSDLTVTRIAEECGFEEQSNFNHMFRKMLGCSPSSWRRRHKNA